MPPDHKPHLLLIEDSEDDAALVLQTLRQAGLKPTLRKVESAPELLAALAEETFDLVMSDYNLPGFDGAEALRLLRRHSLEIPFIVVSGQIGEEVAVEMMRNGADDYVMKDNLARLPAAVERSLEQARTRKQAHLLESALKESHTRLRNIAAYIPGIVLQLLLDKNENWSFSYMSEGCRALLGLDSQEVMRDPGLFFDRIAPEESVTFVQAMQESARALTDWNWEGRIRGSGSDEVQWVSLRASPRPAGDGSILWDGMLINITPNKKTELELRHSRQQLSKLSAHIQSVKEQERTRIAREIHDDLGGTLTATKIELMRLARDLVPGSDLALQHLHSTEALVDSALDTARRIATDLRPGILDLGIVAAIEWQSAQFQKRMDMPCKVSCAVEEIALDDEIAMAMFRIYQETLTNVAKHAGASRVDVLLEADEHHVKLTVNDNGRGLVDADLSKPRAFGIRGMQERAINLGGQASVSQSTIGTTASVNLPRSLPQSMETAASDAQHLLFSSGMMTKPAAPAAGTIRKEKST